MDQVLRRLTRFDDLPRRLVADEVRMVLEAHRDAWLRGDANDISTIEETVASRIEALLSLSLRPVINATGVILHTNLGRAPLAEFAPVTGYSNLEYDLATGKRGKRDDQIAPLLERLLGSPAIVVNNNAAAVFLVLNELAAGGEAIVSRGELIEIGDGFRIPEIMERAGVSLREVGTTNRTRIQDYEHAINERTRLILRVHPSNFHVAGFTAKPALRDLCALGRGRGIPVFEDLGSGCLFDLRPYGVDEPPVRDSLGAGVNVVSFSCDKLLGGPQAGIIAGDVQLIQRVRRNPIYRAFRVDKLILQSLQSTFHHLLRENWAAIPALRMIMASGQTLHERACRISARLNGFHHEICSAESPIGGGSTPDSNLPTWVINLCVPNAARFEHGLRNAGTPVVSRIERGRVILDMRTVSDNEMDSLVAAVGEAAGST